MPRHLFFLALTTLTSCYSDPAAPIIICQTGVSACPDGQLCVDGRCSGVDMSVAETGDMRATDMLITTTADGSTPPDIASTSGCAKGGGIPIGKARGCKDRFSSGGAKSVCQSPYAPCTTASGIDQTACSTVAGFFAAEQPAYWIGTMATETCGTAVGNQELYGCGTSGRSGTVKCGSGTGFAGFPVLIDVGIGGPWSSSNGTLASSANTDSNHGVLCCPP